MSESEQASSSIDRKAFLKQVGIGVAMATAVTRWGSEPAVAAAGQQFGMVIDLRACFGCRACTVACKAENGVPLGSFRMWTKYTEVGEYPRATRQFLPVLCNHCDTPACTEACPTQAVYKAPNGIVDIAKDRCIGCKACAEACPYDAIYMHPQTGLADKCNLCAHRVAEGRDPACVQTCPAEALIFGDLNDPESKPARVLADLQGKPWKPEKGLGPNVLYIDPHGALEQAGPGGVNRL
jgi:tetrathionate reductase subunit B